MNMSPTNGFDVSGGAMPFSIWHILIHNPSQCALQIKIPTYIVREDKLRRGFDVPGGAKDGTAEDRAGGDQRLATDLI